MRKVILFIVVCFLTIVSCQEKVSYTIDDLGGAWSSIAVKSFDADKKLIEDTLPKDDYNCGQMIWTIGMDEIDVMHYVGRDKDDNCMEAHTILKYSVAKDVISTIDENGIHEHFEIVNLTKDILTVMVKLPKPVEYNGSAFQYVELTYEKL